MDILKAIQLVFSTMGNTFFVPIIFFIIGKIMGVSTKKAFLSAVLVGVGLKGFGFVISSFTAVIQPIVDQMISNTGVQLSIVDVGWQTTSLVAFSTQIGITFFVLAIPLEFLLFTTKWTDVFMVSDLWNNHGTMLWGSMLYIVTGNFWLSMGLMVLITLYTVTLGELLAKRWQNYFGYKNCCQTHPSHNNGAILYVFLNIILSKIGFNRIHLNAGDMQRKFGVFGEPMVLGLFVGALIGIIGNYNLLGTLSAWSMIASCAIACSAMMAVFPRIAGLFASAFTSLADALKKKAAEKGEGREWYIGINDAAAYGETITITGGLLMIPITLALAFIVPGNQFLPMAGLVSIPYGMQMIVAVTDGNLAKCLVISSVNTALNMLFTTMLAPIFMQVAMSCGYQFAQAGTGVMFAAGIGHPILSGFFYAFLSGSPILIGGLVALYFGLWYCSKHYRKPIENYLARCNGTRTEEIEQAA